jgi:hypothetical protein
VDAGLDRTMSSAGSATEEHNPLSTRSDQASPSLAGSCPSASSERTQDQDLSFPSPISRLKPVSQPRTPAIKSSNGVQSPRLRCDCNVTATYPQYGTGW